MNIRFTSANPETNQRLVFDERLGMWVLHTGTKGKVIRYEFRHGIAIAITANE